MASIFGTKRTIYSGTTIDAIRCLLWLSRFPLGEFQTTTSLCESLALTRAAAIILLSKLNSGGFIATQPGKPYRDYRRTYTVHGLVCLKMPLPLITVKMVVDEFDPPHYRLGCVMMNKSCDQSRLCPLHEHWQRVLAEVEAFESQLLTEFLIPPPSLEG